MSFKPYSSSLIFLLILQSTYGANILGLFINGHRSHMLMYMSVVQVLLDRGEDNITLVTTSDIGFSVRSNEKNLRHIQLPDIYTTLERDVNHGRGIGDIIAILSRIEHTKDFLNDPQWKAFMQESSSFDLMLLGYLFNDYQFGVAAHFNCPIVVIWTSQPISFINSLMGNPEERSYVTQPYDRHQSTGVNALAYGIFEKLVEQIALDEMRRVYDIHFPSPHYPRFSDMRRNVSLVLCNHHSLSEGPIAPYVPGIIEIGGIQSMLPFETLQENLNEIENDKDLIFFSFGSRIKWSSISQSTFDSFLSAFEKFSNYSIYWTYDGDCEELAKFTSNIHCSAWWPQNSILANPRTKLFITHGGKGSISEAIYHGVPILGLPIFGDQRANIAKMVKQQFGLRLNILNITTEALTDAMQILLYRNLTYFENIKRFSQLYRDRPMMAKESALFWIDYVIRHKGAAHLHSSRLFMNTIEIYSIDIYALLVSISFIIVLLCNCIERLIDWL